MSSCIRVDRGPFQDTKDTMPDGVTEVETETAYRLTNPGLGNGDPFVLPVPD